MNDNVFSLARARCKNGLNHQGKLEIDEEAGTVQCSTCGKFISPIQALVMLAKSETMQRHRLDELNRAIKKAHEKKQCKCQHCGKLTLIDKSLGRL